MRTLTWLSTLCRALYWLPLCLCFLSSSANAAWSTTVRYYSEGRGIWRTTMGGNGQTTGVCQETATPTQGSSIDYPSGKTVGDTVFDGTYTYLITGSFNCGALANYMVDINKNLAIGLRCSGQNYTVVDDQLWCGSDPPPAPACPSSGTSVGHTLITGDITGSASIAGTGVCISNPDAPGTPGAVCGVQCNSGAVSVDPVTGVSQMYCQTASFTGGTCSGGSVAGADPGPDPEFGEEKEPEGNCPPGTASGQINDLDVCLPSGSTVSNDVKKVTQGNKTLTTTKNQTVNPDGSVTTTITNIYNDGTSSTSSTTTTTDDKINAGGNDSSNNGGKDGSEDMPIPDMDTSLGGFEALPTRVPDNPVFSTSIIATSASCPPPITFTVMDIDLSIDFEPVCDLAPMIRAIMLILAGVVALRVVVSK
ncbi:MAG: hypothetical protein JNIBNLAF_00300 [Nitrosomonas europaea]|nr:hypothetical protein [Nitrosomonas europaea]